MPAFVVTDNIMRRLVSPADVVFPGGPDPDPNMSPLRLFNGDLDRGWIANTERTSCPLDMKMPAGEGIAFVGVYGVRPLTTSGRVFVYGSTWPVNVGTMTQIAEVQLDARGDGFALIAKQTWAGVRLSFTLPTAQRLQVGKVVLGLPTDLPSYPLAFRRDPLFTQISNTSESGGSYVYELADRRERIDLEYNNVTASTWSAIQDVWRATRGGREPCVLVPGATDPGASHFGRFDPRLETSHGVGRVVSGLRLRFVESGRAL